MLVEVYAGRGACKCSAQLAVTWLRQLGFLSKQTPKLPSSEAGAFVIAGGKGKEVLEDLGATGVTTLQERVVDYGLKYLGICCGGYLAAARVLYNTPDTHRDQLGFGFLQGQAVGPCFGTIPHLVRLDTPQKHSAGTAFYFSGGSWHQHDGEVLATFAGTGMVGEYPCLIRKGNVLVTSVHPEHPRTESHHLNHQIRAFLRS